MYGLSLVQSVYAQAVQMGPASGRGVLHLVIQASPFVIFTLLLLLFFSVGTWTIIFVKIRQLRKANGQSLAFLDAFWRAKSLSQVQGQVPEFAHSPVAEIFRVGYAELNKLSQVAGLEDGLTGEGPFLSGLDNLGRSLNRAARAEMTRLSQYLTFLATTGNTAPFIGLFGTVIGIMNAFMGIGAQGSASLATVAPGIAEALIATAAGLAAAIPAVVAYNHFLSRIRKLEAEMTAFSADFLNLLERNALRKAQSKRAA